MDRFYAFANRCYANWVPLVAVPWLLVGAGFLIYQQLTALPAELRVKHRIEALKQTHELIDEIQGLSLPDTVKIVEVKELTSAKGYLLITGEYETTQTKEDFLRTYTDAVRDRQWEFAGKKIERNFETMIFCRSGVQLDLTYHPSGILSSTDQGLWKIWISEPHDALPEKCAVTVETRSSDS